MVHLTRKIDFCAAHRLWVDSLSPEENREIFGECSRLHGHNYVLEVTFAGEPDPQTGMVINLSEIDAIVKERVIDHLDHRNLNEDIKEFKHTRTDWRIGVPNILFTFRDRRKGVLSAEKAGVKL